MRAQDSAVRIGGVLPRQGGFALQGEASALDLASFLKLYRESGLRTPPTAVAIGDEEPWSLGPSPKMLLGKHRYYNDPDSTPEERALDEAVVKATGHPALRSCAVGWSGMRMLLAGIETAGSIEIAISRPPNRDALSAG